MAADFKIIAITPELPRRDETDWIRALLAGKNTPVDRVHVRHPGHDFRCILQSLPTELLSKITIHDYPELLDEFPEVGFHFNRRVPFRHLDGKRILSASCHSWSEVSATCGLDYVTLSPVYDSLSKRGYKADKALLSDMQKSDVDVVALGGINVNNLTALKGFAGAAMLGTFDVPLSDLPNLLERINEKVETLCSSL